MNVLFLCASNVFRSQMAETFFNEYSTKNTAESAALIRPQDKMHKLIIRAMKEENFDITNNRSKKVSADMIKRADMVILMSPDLKKCLEEFNIAKTILIEIWQIPDVIAKETDEHLYQNFVKARNIIKEKVKELVKKID